MLVSIGSRSTPKVIGASRAFSKFPELWLEDGNLEFIVLPKKDRGEAKNAEIDALSQVSCNPFSLKEIFSGAKNRAKSAYEYATKERGKCNYSVGLESGLFEVPEVNTKYLEISVAVIFDGKDYSYGTSPAHELPKSAVSGAINGIEPGFMPDVFGCEIEEIKGRKGIIGIVTDGRLNRDEFEEYSTICAIAQIIKKDIYKK